MRFRDCRLIVSFLGQMLLFLGMLAGCSSSSSTQSTPGAPGSSAADSGSSGENCAQQTCPDPAAGTYKTCHSMVSLSGECSSYVETCGGTTFSCASCTDCNDALSQATDWCNGTSAGCSATPVSEAGPAPQSCGGQFTGNASCNACVNENCCAQATACFADSDCKAIVTCTASCGLGDLACLEGCVAMHPNGQNAYQSANSCYQSNCANSPACQ
jgi:hypothetical protein